MSSAQLLLALSGFLNFLISFSLIIFVLLKSRNHHAIKSFFIFFFSICEWSFFYWLWLIIPIRWLQEIFLRTCMIGVMFMAPAAFHFVYEMGEEDNKKFIGFNYLIALLFSVLLFTPLYANSGDKFLEINFWLKAGPLFPLTLVFFYSNGLLALLSLNKAIKKGGGPHANQLKYIKWGMIIGFLAGSFNYPCWYGVPFYPWANFFVALGLLSIPYAIITENLFDIDLIFHYSFIAGVGSLIGFGVTALVLVIAKLLFSSIFPLSPGVILLTSAIVAFFIFSSKYLIDFLYNLSNEYILRHKYDYLKNIRAEVPRWAKILNLEKLQKIVSEFLKREMNLDRTELFSSGLYVIGSHKYSHDYLVWNPEESDEAQSNVLVKSDSPLINFFTRHHSVVLFDDVVSGENSPALSEKVRKIYGELRLQMSELKAGVIIPFYEKEGPSTMLLGFLLLGRRVIEEAAPAGQKQTILPYLSEDRELFNFLLAEAGLIFTNAVMDRKNFILDKKKDSLIQDSIAESRKFKKEKESFENTKDELEDEAMRMMKLAADLAATCQQLRESEEELAIMAEEMASAILVIRADKIAAANVQARKLLSETFQNIAGKNYQEIIEKCFSEPEKIIETIKNSLAKGQTEQIFEASIKKAGLEVPVDLKIIPLKGSFHDFNKITGVLVQITDISGAKEYQKEKHIKDKYETFKNMLEGLRHEIYNPFNALNLIYQMMKNNEQSLADPAFVELFKDSVPKSINQIKSVIESMKESQEAFELEDLEPVNLNQLIESVLMFKERRWSQEKIIVKKNFGSMPEVLIKPDHFSLALEEILKNSAAAIAEYDVQRLAGQEQVRGGTIEITTRLTAERKVEITIADDGIGVDQKLLDNILDPFRTTKVHSTSHQEDGIGLGLNKVYHILTAYAGQMKIQSKAGEGTRVTLTLPEKVISEKKPGDKK